MKTYATPKLRQIVTEAVFRRRRIFLLTLFVVLGLVLLLSFAMHKKFEASAKLMVQNVRSQAPLSTNSAERLVNQGDVSPAELNSEVDLLQSQQVVRRALDGQSASSPASEQEQKDIVKLQHALTVENVHQTNLINVKLLANSPGEAEAKLGRLLDAYFEERAGTGRSTGAADFFERQADAAAHQLDADRAALTSFEVQHNLADLDEQKKLQVQRIAALEDKLADASATLARTESRTMQERRQLSLTPSRSTTQQRTITNQYTQERLNTSLVELQNRRTELMKRYQPSDRQILELNDKIATTQRAIAEAGQHPAGEVQTDVNPVWQQLTASVATSSGEVSGIAAQRAELARQKKEADARLHELQEATGTYDTLKRKLQQTQADYTLYAQKRDEARIAQALDRAKMFDVALVQAPTASLEPVRPKPVLYMLAGLVFALLLGTALALYADTSAEQVYTPAQLDAVTGVRTISTLADEDDADGHRDQNLLEYRRVLFAIRNTLREAPRGAGVADDAGYCVAFVSALRGEGVSYVVRNVASEAARQANSRIAVLDMRALLRKFEAERNVSFALKHDEKHGHWVLALDGVPKAGTSVDAGSATAESGEKPVAMWEGGTQGQFSARMLPLLQQARQQFEFVLLDCPSFAESTLASELDPCVDGYVAIVSAGRARKQNLEGLAAILGEVRAPLLGYVLNRRTYPVPRWLHKALW